MRDVRIVGGPYFGVLLLRIITMDLSYIKMAAFIFFNIGVYMRPDIKRKPYKYYKTKHGYFMLGSFTTVVLTDIYYCIKYTYS
jgi:hypothetical protein